MTTVHWGIANTPDDASWIELAHLPIEPVLPSIVKDRNTENEGHYTKCPAFIDYYKNVYVIRSPIDTTFTYTEEGRYLQVSPQHQDFFDASVMHRGDVIGENDPFLMSLSLYHVFIADSPCMIELLPVTYHLNPPPIRIIGGTYDIQKWYRFIELAFEFIDNKQSISIRRGDPLMYVRFVTPENTKIKLVKKDLSPSELKAMRLCVNLKTGMPKQPLKYLYKLAERVIKPKKKCPFYWRK